MTLAAGARIGRYVVQRKLAEGGMAQLFLAAAEGPEGFSKQVVVKRVRPVLARDPAFVSMFVSEARLASQLNHANLVQIFDFGRDEDTYYLAMEYVRGGSLWDVRQRCREQMIPLPPLLAAQIAVEVARGLDHAHRLTDGSRPLGLVHRDVSPHNVLLSLEGAVKLTDFGIAKAGESQTAAGMLKGKFAYMSPEQSRGEPVDARTDIFALGIVLWEALTGARLFEADSDVGVLRAVQQREIIPARRLNEEVPEALDAVVQRALAREPQQRYATAADFASALAGCVLRGARSVEETDVGAFVRRVLGDRPVEALEAAPVEVPAREPGAPAPQALPREPTAVMPGQARSARPETPREDDFGGSTEVLRRGAAKDEVRLERTAVSPSRTPGLAPAAAAAGVARASEARPPPVSSGVSGIPPTPQPRPPARKGRGRWALAGGVLVVGAGALLAQSHARSSDGARDSGVTLPAASGAADGSAVAPPDAGPALTAQPVLPAPLAQPLAVDGGRSLARAESTDAGAALPASAVSTGAAALPAASVDAGAGASLAQQPAAAMGTLVIYAAPWAHAELDGRRLGDVTLKGSFSVPAGSHRLRLTFPSGSESTQVTLGAGQTLSHHGRPQLH